MERIWNKNNDNGAVHAIGNGRICVYEIGPEILQAFGYPYSAGTCFSLSSGAEHCISRRKPGTNTWEHVLDNGAVFTDIADSVTHCFIRKISADQPLTLTLTLQEDEDAVLKKDTLHLSTPRGNRYYNYRVNKNIQNIFKGVNCTFTQIQPREYLIQTMPGTCYLLFGETEQDMKAALLSGFEKIQQRTEQIWQEALMQMKPFSPALKEICENIAVLIKAQQGEDGGVLAGYNYHLAYVRDQYGTARGLMAMGLINEAKAIMYYYKSVFDEKGELHNAQSIGDHSVFHIHENDAVEITGYLVLLTFQLYEQTKDDLFLQDMLPLIRWAIQKQKEQLKNNMLPFNGDETYIAGGMLPRDTIYDGSAESTMLFLTSLQHYLAVFDDAELQKLYEKIRQAYPANFIIQEQLYTNNPERMAPEEYPPTRNGVCEGCGAFGSTFKNIYGRFCCPECLKKNAPGPRVKKHFLLPAVSLAPVYIGADCVPLSVIRSMVQPLKENFQKNGVISGSAAGEVGYSYGFFLIALLTLEDPMAEEIYEYLLRLLDEAGAWVEYYKNGLAFNTRCRPWESGINIEALIRFEEKKNAPKKQ